MGIGLKIKELAGKKNLTLSELAKRLGKTKQAVYEMVEKEDLNSAIIKECASIFGVSPGYFFGEITDSKDIQEKLDLAYIEIDRLKKENANLRMGSKKSTKVVVELDVTQDEFIKMGLKDKVIQILNK